MNAAPLNVTQVFAPVYVHTSEIAPDPMTLPGLRLDIAPDPDFTRKFGARVRALGGRYSECRGYSNCRFVEFNTINEQIVALINDITIAIGTPSNHVDRKGVGKFTFVFNEPKGAQLGNARSWIVVHCAHSFAEAARLFVSAYENAVSRGLAKTAAQIKDQWDEAAAEDARLQAVKAEMAAIPGAEVSDHYKGSARLPLANGLVLGLTATSKGIGIGGLTFDMVGGSGKHFTAEQVEAIAQALSGVAL